MIEAERNMNKKEALREHSDQKCFNDWANRASARARCGSWCGSWCEKDAESSDHSTQEAMVPPNRTPRPL